MDAQIACGDNVIDVDDEQQRRQNSTLRDASSRSNSLGFVDALGDTEGTIGEEGAKPQPSFACNTSLSAQLVQQPIVGHAIKGFDNVEENHWQLFLLAHGVIYGTAMEIQMI